MRQARARQIASVHSDIEVDYDSLHEDWRSACDVAATRAVEDLGFGGKVNLRVKGVDAWEPAEMIKGWFDVCRNVVMISMELYWEGVTKQTQTKRTITRNRVQERRRWVGRHRRG